MFSGTGTDGVAETIGVTIGRDVSCGTGLVSAVPVGLGTVLGSGAAEAPSTPASPGMSSGKQLDRRGREMPYKSLSALTLHQAESAKRWLTASLVEKSGSETGPMLPSTPRSS